MLTKIEREREGEREREKKKRTNKPMYDISGLQIITTVVNYSLLSDLRTLSPAI